jgi:H+-translocating diphosphatase
LGSDDELGVDGKLSNTANKSQNISNMTMSLFSGVCFLLGAICSAFSGYAGMWVSVRANVRTASAARKCYNEAITIAF